MEIRQEHEPGCPAKCTLTIPTTRSRRYRRKAPVFYRYGPLPSRISHSAERAPRDPPTPLPRTFGGRVRAPHVQDHRGRARAGDEAVRRRLAFAGHARAAGDRGEEVRATRGCMRAPRDRNCAVRFIEQTTVSARLRRDVGKRYATCVSECSVWWTSCRRVRDDSSLVPG